MSTSFICQLKHELIDAIQSAC